MEFINEIKNSRDLFEQCFVKFDGKNVEFAIVIGFASSGGNSRCNHKFVQERTITVKRAIKSKFPDIGVVKIIASIIDLDK